MGKLRPEQYHRHRHDHRLAPQRRYRKCAVCASQAPVYDVPLPGDATLYATLCAVCEAKLSREPTERGKQALALVKGGAR